MLRYFCSLVNRCFLSNYTLLLKLNNWHLKAACRQWVETALVDGSTKV